MGTYTKQNLRDVENQAPKFGMPSELEARFARSALDGKTLGLSLFKLDPDFRIPFGHKHESQEEVYVVLRGSARIKVEDEIVELGEWDAIKLDRGTMRDVEAGPDGVRVPRVRGGRRSGRDRDGPGMVARGRRRRVS
jgi:mannose-6-phosphate isomerase-like protein (cupin superfamily)